MEAKLPSGWKLIKQHLVSILVVIIILVVTIALIIVGYRFDWTGFNGNTKSGKTLWDWMQLLFIPVVLAVAGFLFNHRERKAAELRADNERKAAELRAEAEREIEHQRAKTESDIAEDNQREEALQAYLDKMSELLLEKHLRESDPDAEVRKIARVRTLTVLRDLKSDAERKESILEILYESGLIDMGKRIIDLSGGDLSQADVSGAHLSGADLSGANLRKANLSNAILFNANFSNAILEEANFNKSWVTKEQLAKAKSLKGATMPDGSIHP